VPLPVMGRLALDNFPAGLFTADEAGRAPFAQGFVTDEMLAGKSAAALAARTYNLTGDNAHSWDIPGPSASWTTVEFENFTGAWTECTFTTTETSDLSIHFSATLSAAPGDGTFDFRAVVDGTELERISHSAIFTGALHFAATWPFPELPPGEHAVKIQFRHDKGAAVAGGLRGRYLVVEVFPCL
jgi:hypothetical protein